MRRHDARHLRADDPAAQQRHLQRTRTHHPTCAFPRPLPVPGRTAVPYTRGALQSHAPDGTFYATSGS
ncbi:hypothetical protein SLNWT_1944 [Streptomyces albus]|uniref:Uncharacterized protein n=1 Tax=Streptomyces albus (strain ATCC 21838 / DSM 41398 / FERM P-419 / JCM 4703 / NBRC 107858) TaxID=1081613 RepID=A0A0B5ESV0_STRA4|nr:hypothetical protein SLNWT_1944 [Streptomyces albus]AOU76637.1 hypothetical protein SLNHY_1946 [Streptomyces albus]